MPRQFERTYQMDETTVISDKAHKMLNKMFGELAFLEKLATRQSNFYTMCRSVLNSCLYLKDVNPEAIKPNFQHLKQLKECFDTEMREKYLSPGCALNFDSSSALDIEQLAFMTSQLCEEFETYSSYAQQAKSAFERLPDLFVKICALNATGTNTSSLEEDLKKTSAELNRGKYPTYFINKETVSRIAPQIASNRSVKKRYAQANATQHKFHTMLLYFPRQVEKLEHFLDQHAQDIKNLESQEVKEPIKEKITQYFESLVELFLDNSPNLL